MFKKIIACSLIAGMLAVPCTALASHHHHPRPEYHRHSDYHRGHRRYYRHGRSMHRGDYAAIAAGVIIGAILASR